MKISSERPAPEVMRRAAPTEQPTRAFDAYLDDREPNGMPGSRALGFGELGMFGIFAPIEFGPQPSTTGVQGAVLAQTSEGQDPSTPMAPSPAPAGLTHGASVSSSPMHLLPTPPAQSPGPMRGAIDEAQPTMPAGEAAAGAVAEERFDIPRGSGPPIARSRVPNQSKPAMSLILAERDGKLEIVAGGVPVEPEARRLVMRRATETAASFGLTVGQYSLNGVALGSGRGETLWRFHGTRTR